MAAAHGAGHGGSHEDHDITAHRAMFDGFLKVTEWACVFLAMTLALIIFAFAVGLGWWTGLIAYFVIGLAAGFGLRMGGAWWALLVVSTVLLAVGGAITMALTGAG